MSRLDDIKARYGWCERCANHDPRDRRDHGHLRSQTEIDALWLVEQVERLERWKVEALEVMSGLQELGKALRAALTGSEADTTDVDVCSGDADCTSALHVHGCFADSAGPCTDPDEHHPTGQEDAPDVGHQCEPYYSRAECGQCGWQEQWCVTCSRQMCGCATDAMGADQ